MGLRSLVSQPCCSWPTMCLLMCDLSNMKHMGKWTMLKIRSGLHQGDQAVSISFYYSLDSNSEVHFLIFEILIHFTLCADLLYYPLFSLQEIQLFNMDQKLLNTLVPKSRRIDLDMRKRTKPMKILCLGLSRTGTICLSFFLTQQ